MTGWKWRIDDDHSVDVGVDVGGWEHSCCGRAIERGRVVDITVVRSDGSTQFLVVVRTTGLARRASREQLRPR